MLPKENMLRAIRRDRPAWVPCGAEATFTIEPPLLERPYSAGYDVFGVHWTFEAQAEGGTYPTPTTPVITDLRRWRDQVAIPDVAGADWSNVAAAIAALDRDQVLVQGFVHMGLFERSYLLLGMEEALVNYALEPDLMSDLLDALADYKIAVITTFHEVAHLDMVWYGDDWGTQDRLFLSPSLWRRVIKPHTQRIYDCMKARGILINQHSCGRIEAIFGDVVEMGADMWNPCQPCNDLAHLKRTYGDRIAFFGGLDSQFVLGCPGATPDDVWREVRRRIDEMAPGGGYIAAPSHDVPYDPDLLWAMRDEIDGYGRAFYRGTA
ncbi:MAG: uroporphyrinogen decarboxylase family protein [Chloroflexota bacterium]|jgi:uroporphyrinogen-III decarboxylase